MKTIQELIRIVQDRISLPLDDDDRWSTAAVVNALNDALDEKLTPDLVSENSNYLIQREVFTLSSYPLKAIPIPNRAVGRIVRELKYIASGTEITDEVNCLAITLDEKDKYSKDPAFYNSKVPYVFIENDSVRFIGGDGTGSIAIYYSLEPSILQNITNQYATVTDCISKTVNITVSSTLNSTTLTTTTNPSTLNILPNMPISGTNIPTGATVVSTTTTVSPYNIVISIKASGTGSSITATVSQNEITATSAGTNWDTYQSSGSTKFVDIYRKSTGAIVKSNVRVSRSSTYYYIFGLTDNEINQIKTYQYGGFPVSAPYESELVLLPAGKSEFSTIPYEYDQLLSLYVCERILESLGDTEGLQVTMAKIKETKESISRLSQNRLQSEKRKLEDRRTVANAEPRSIQSLILDLYDTVRVPFDQDPRWATTAIIRAFNNVMVDKLAPDLVAEGSNYLVHRDVVQLTVSGTAVYPLNSIPLPRRAIGRSLREVKYLPSGKTKLEDELNCPAISLEEKDMYSSESDVYGSSVPFIYMENDNLRLVGGDLNGSLVLYYSLEPSKLTATYGRYASATHLFLSNTITVSTTSGSPTLSTGTTNPNTLGIVAGMYITGTNIPANSVVSSISSNTIVISNNASATGTSITASLPTQFVATAGGSWDSYQSTGTTKLIDIFCKSTGAILKSNVQITRITNAYLITGLTTDEINQIKTNQTGGFPVSTTYTSELLLVPAGECEFVTIPEEFDQLLVLYVAEKISESLGDADGLSLIKNRINDTRNSINRVTGNRLQGERRRLTDRRSIARIQRGQKWTRNYNKNYR